MAEDIKQEMNTTPGCIPTKWTRTTVADGDWLQENTIKPLSSRDNFLADKLSAASVDLDALSAAIATVSSISDSKDTFLSGSIDYVSATLDSFSAKVETSAENLYNSITAERNERLRGDEDLQGKINVLEAANDVIMVYGTHEEFVAGSASLHLTDKDVIKVLFDDTVSSNQVYYEYTLSTNSWDKIGELDPYYSKAEIESFSANLSSTIANTYLSANGTDISAGKNLDVVIQSNNPRVAFKTKDNVSFESITATTFSGNTIKGETKTSTIDGLITSAEEGNKAANGKTEIEIYYNDNDTEKDSFEISSYGDKFSFYVSAQPSSPTWMQFTTGDFNTPGYPHAVVLSADKNLCQNWLNFDSKMYKSDFENWSASQNSKFNGSARLAGSADLANSASIAANTQDKITAYYKEGNTNKTGTFNVSSLALSAGKGINFVSAANQLSISSEGTTYTTGQYINISNDNKISVTGTLINSAQSGQSAYNWITAKSATLSAGPGIKFTSANPNTMGITITAGGVGGVITAIAGSALSAGSNYTQGRCITIDNQNKINLSSDINLNSKLVIDHYNDSYQESYASANLESYKLDFSGSRDSGGSYRNKSATYRIDYLKIDNYYNADDLHFAYLDESKLQLSASTKMNAYTVGTCTNIANDYFEMEWKGSPSVYYLKFDGKTISAGTYSTYVTTAYWSNVIDAATGTWVSGTSQRITIEAPSQTKLVFTATLPPTLEDNTYYIV